MFKELKQWLKNVVKEIKSRKEKMTREAVHKKRWEGPYLHEDLNVEVQTKEEHETAAHILRMKVKEINATLRDFKNDVKRTPELWSPRKYQLIGRALKKRINELDKETLRRAKAWNTIDEIVGAMAWMREQRAYANINKEAERREMERIRKGQS